MEGWVDIFEYMNQTFKSDIILNVIIINIWFMSVILIGGYLLISLFLAVVKTTFSNIHSGIYITKQRPFSELIQKKKIKNEEMIEEKTETDNENESINNLDNSDNLNTENKEEEIANKNKNKDFYSYSIVKDLLILQKSSPIDVYKLKKKIVETKAINKMKEKEEEELEINRKFSKFNENSISNTNFLLTNL